MSKEILENMTRLTEKSIQSFKNELLKVRTGRASSALVDTVSVDYYGSRMPLNQVANITTPDAKTIQIVPWETQMVGAIEKSILAANLGLTPHNDGKLIRISLPPLTQERRHEMVKLVKKMGEEAKIEMRNHRRESNDHLKKLEKTKIISQDDLKKGTEQIQKKTDEKILEIDRLIQVKEKEILTI